MIALAGDRDLAYRVGFGVEVDLVYGAAFGRLDVVLGWRLRPREVHCLPGVAERHLPDRVSARPAGARVVDPLGTHVERGNEASASRLAGGDVTRFDAERVAGFPLVLSQPLGGFVDGNGVVLT